MPLSQKRGVETVEIISSAEFAKACRKTIVHKSSRQKSEGILSFLEKHPADLAEISASVFAEACGKISTPDAVKMKSEPDQCCPELPRRSRRVLQHCPDYRETQVSDSEDSGSSNSQSPSQGPEAVKKARINGTDSSTDSEVANHDSREIQVSDSEDPRSINSKSPPKEAPAVKKARINGMDSSTGSKVYNHDSTETARAIELSCSDSESPQRGPDVVKTDKKTFVSNAMKRQSVKAKVSQSSSPPKYCHSCRRRSRNVTHLVRCSRCVLAFCGKCLALRHGEDSLEEAGPGLQWVCPKCRGGCGPGCEKFCCTCSQCRPAKWIHSPIWAGQKTIKHVLKSTVFDVWHDYLIHLETGESKEQIANRKCSRGWTKAGGSGGKNSNFIGAANHLSPTEKKTANKNRRNAGDGSDDELTCQSDQLWSHHNQKRQNVTSEFGCTTDEMETDEGSFNPNVELSLSATDEFHANTKLCKVLKDSLVPFDDMAVNVYLMGLWFSKDKNLIGKRTLSISLSEKEVQVRNAIKARSHAKAIAYQFGPTNKPNTFLGRPKYQQEEMKNRLKDLTLRKELEESRMHLHQVCEKMNVMVTEHLSRAKKNIILAIERLTDSVANAADGIQHDPANLEGDIVTRKVAVEKIIGSILWITDPPERESYQTEMDTKKLSENNESEDRSTLEFFEMTRTSRKALGAELDRLGILTVSVYLASEWFSRKKDWKRNRLLINLSDKEVEVKNELKKAMLQILLTIQMCGARRDVEEQFEVNLRNELSDFSIAIDSVLQEIDVMIAQALPDVKRNGDLALGNMTDAVQKAVDAIN